MAALTPAQKSAFRRDGVLTLPGLVPPAAAAAALRAINWALGRPRPPEMPMGPDQEALSGYHTNFWDDIIATPAILDLLHASPIWALAESLLGQGAVLSHARPQIALRFPERGERRLEYHIDLFNVPGGMEEEIRKSSFSLTAGVLLSDVPAPFMGNFTVVPGSHEEIARYFREHGPVSMREGIPPEVRLGDPRQITGRAGDVVLCHYQVAHDRVHNASPFIRYMVFFRLKHKEHERQALEAGRDPWLHWSGLRGRPAHAR